MAGYFRMPEKTVEAWRNLWFHTGDAGRFDDYVDRLKDCIRRRGDTWDREWWATWSAADPLGRRRPGGVGVSPRETGRKVKGLPSSVAGSPVALVRR